MEKLRNKLHFTHFLLIAILFGVGMLVGRMSVVPPPKHSKNENVSTRELGNGKYSFINPLLDCTEIVNATNQLTDNTKQAVSDYAATFSSPTVSQVAVYFRDLNNGPGFGINDTTQFFPASLLKVPLMMSAYRQAMDMPGFLDKTATFDGPSRNNEHFKAPQELQPNVPYKVADVVDDMIQYSDNNASHVLSYLLDGDRLNQSYLDLGLQPPDRNDYAISVKDYASFFRILYNGTFLDRQYSEKALKLLSQTTFDNGIVAGIPKGVIVAHKFGERQVGNDTKQLHDCGIIYAPKHPYLLCIMTRGDSFDNLDDVIAGISKIVYNKIVNNN